MNWKRALSRVALLGALVLPSQVPATDSEYHKIADGVDIYLGVVPTHVIQSQQDERLISMHRGVPASSGYHHVMVALFDHDTGKRISDAKVTARVHELAMTGKQKTLESMDVADGITYANYFPMPQSGVYRIDLKILRSGTARPVEARLEYVHVHND